MFSTSTAFLFLNVAVCFGNAGFAQMYLSIYFEIRAKQADTKTLTTDIVNLANHTTDRNGMFYV